MGASHRQDRYDVVVAGAGPAGAQCARDLAARNYDVVVLETESEAAFPDRSNKSTGGTFQSVLKTFDVPDEVVTNFTDALVLESPSNYVRREYPGAVLDFASFKRFLVEDGQRKGAEYRFDARVAGPLLAGNEVVGVRYDGDEEVRADVVVDATGPSAALAKPLGMSDLKRRTHAIGIEYEFEGVDVKNPYYADLTDSMMLRLDNEYAPGGYAWIFHTGADTAKVGVCYLHHGSHTRRADGGRTIDEYLQHWLDSDPRLKSAERKEGTARRGSAHVQPPGQLSTDNVLAIGDTVPTVDPLWGEGIYKCMQSARAAAKAVDRCLGNDPPDGVADLSLYDDRWHEEVAPDADARRLAADLLYRFSDDRFDVLLDDLDRLGYEVLDQASKGDRRAMAKLVHLRDIPVIAKVAWSNFVGRR